MLELLSLRKGTTLTKEMFLNHLYGGMDEPELKIIDVFICKLRKKLANARRQELHRDSVGPRLRAARTERRRRPHPGLSRRRAPGAATIFSTRPTQDRQCERRRHGTRGNCSVLVARPLAQPLTTPAGSQRNVLPTHPKSTPRSFP